MIMYVYVCVCMCVCIYIYSHICVGVLGVRIDTLSILYQVYSSIRYLLWSSGGVLDGFRYSLKSLSLVGALVSSIPNKLCFRAAISCKMTCTVVASHR